MLFDPSVKVLRYQLYPPRSRRVTDVDDRVVAVVDRWAPVGFLLVISHPHTEAAIALERVPRPKGVGPDGYIAYRFLDATGRELGGFSLKEGPGPGHINAVRVQEIDVAHFRPERPRRSHRSYTVFDPEGRPLAAISCGRRTAEVVFLGSMRHDVRTLIAAAPYVISQVPLSNA